MRNTVERSLQEQLLQLIEHGPRPAEGPANALDTSIYSSPDRHRSELTAIAAHPIAAAASSEIANPGSFITMNLCGVPIVITRNRDGQAHASHNVCAHRGATVETRANGQARILSCGFHGWSYELDGTLRAVADAPLFSSQPCDRGLRKVPCEERHGIVWVTPQPTEQSPGMVEWLGAETDELLSDLGMGEMVHHATVDYDLDCNWKLLTDGFLEIYHLMYLHRNSIAPYFPANMTRITRMGEHFFNVLPKNRLVERLTEQPDVDHPILDDLTAAVVLVPGTVVQWQAGHVELFSLRPDPHHPGRSVVRLTMMVPAHRADETDLWDRNWARVCVTIPDEDFAAAVDVQRNINAGVAPSLQIGANEEGLTQHLDALDRLLGVPAQPSRSDQSTSR